MDNPSNQEWSSRSPISRLGKEFLPRQSVAVCKLIVVATKDQNHLETAKTKTSHLLASVDPIETTDAITTTTVKIVSTRSLRHPRCLRFHNLVSVGSHSQCQPCLMVCRCSCQDSSQDSLLVHPHNLLHQDVHEHMMFSRHCAPLNSGFLQRSHLFQAYAIRQRSLNMIRHGKVCLLSVFGRCITVSRHRIGRIMN